MKSGILSVVITVILSVASVNCAPNLQTDSLEVRHTCALTGDRADACVAACAKGCPYTGPVTGAYACQDNQGLYGRSVCVCAASCGRPSSDKDVIAAVDIWIPAVEKLCAQNDGTKSSGVDSDSCIFLNNVIECTCKPRKHHHDSN